MKYVVAYDLYRPGQQHERLSAALTARGGIREQQSVWTVEYAGTAQQLVDELAYVAGLDGNDKLEAWDNAARTSGHVGPLSPAQLLLRARVLALIDR